MVIDGENFFVDYKKYLLREKNVRSDMNLVVLLVLFHAMMSSDFLVVLNIMGPASAKQGNVECERFNLS